MASLFISHASDQALADLVFGWLVAAGHEVFLDHSRKNGIDVGKYWDPLLLERLRGADAVVPIVTAAFGLSAWCAPEVGIARALGTLVLPDTDRLCGAAARR